MHGLRTEKQNTIKLIFAKTATFIKNTKMQDRPMPVLTFPDGASAISCYVVYKINHKVFTMKP